MTNLKQKILDDLKSAMQSGNAEKRDILRMLTSAIKDEEIKKKKRDEGLSDEEVIEVVGRSIKQRKDSIEEYQKGGREDLADQEKKELEVLNEYLPEQLGEEEIRKEIKSIIAETGASSRSDFGRVMGVAMNKLKGKTSGDIVKKIVEEELN